MRIVRRVLRKDNKGDEDMVNRFPLLNHCRGSDTDVETMNVDDSVGTERRKLML